MMSLISGVNTNDKNGPKLRKKDVSMAKVSLAIVFVFIVCHSVKWIPNIYELSQVSFCEVLESSPGVDVIKLFLEEIRISPKLRN